MEMRDEVLSSVGAEDMDTSEYQVSDLEDFQFHCEDLDLKMDAVFRPGTYPPDSRSTFKEFEVASRAENLITIVEEENNEKTPRFQQSLSPRDQPNPLCWREVAPLEQELRIFLITLKEICYVNL